MKPTCKMTSFTADVISAAGTAAVQQSAWSIMCCNFAITTKFVAAFPEFILFSAYASCLGDRVKHSHYYALGCRCLVEQIQFMQPVSQSLTWRPLLCLY